MRIAITGATGNLGTSVIGELGRDSEVEEIVGIARRIPDLELPKVRWEAADMASSDLAPLFAGVDAVVHLAWALHPPRDSAYRRRVNVEGSRRVFDATKEAGVPALISATSFGVYSPNPPKTRERATIGVEDLVDENWPRDGIPTSSYSQEKVAVERSLDALEQDAPNLRVVRFRPALVLKGDAASELRRLFVGGWVPLNLLRGPRLPLIPAVRGLAFQAVHTSDVAQAFHAAIKLPVRGAFNLAAHPVLDVDEIAHAIGGWKVPTDARVLRAFVELAWRARIIPLDPGWIDLALQGPLLDTSRAARELDWKPDVTSVHALRELVDGFAQNRSFATPPLQPNQRMADRVKDSPHTERLVELSQELAEQMHHRSDELLSRWPLKPKDSRPS